MKRFLTLCVVFALLLATPVLAADGYVFDEAGLLSELQRADLNEACVEVENYYDCGVYVVTLQDYQAYGSTPEAAAEAFYALHDLGVDSSDMSDGILLLLSMAERDYSLTCHGYYGNAVFDEGGRSYLEEQFLPLLGDNRWGSAFNAYVSGCHTLLYDYEQLQRDYYGGDYESYYSPGSRSVGDRLLYAADYLGPVVLGSFVFALIVVLLMKRSMRTARQASGAAAYIPSGGVTVKVREDRYTHTTTQVIHHERDDDHGGGGHGGGGGGFSSSSGKF